MLRIIIEYKMCGYRIFTMEANGEYNMNFWEPLLSFSKAFIVVDYT